MPTDFFLYWVSCLNFIIFGLLLGTILIFVWFLVHLQVFLLIYRPGTERPILPPFTLQEFLVLTRLKS